MITAEQPLARRRPCFLGTVPAKEPITVSAADAPFPAEHEEQATRTGERFHLRWIPETSRERYLNGNSALNLHDKRLGEAGDWHQAGWWVPVRHTSARIHYAHLNDSPLHQCVAAELLDTLADTELVDCRPALAKLPHPAGKRNRPVWCATHVRAILELAWWHMREAEAREPGFTLKGVDPTTVARWLGSRDQWVRLHELGDQIGSVLAPKHGLEAQWRDWLACQTPLAHYTTPEERWDLAALDRRAAEELTDV